jgi:hypothetical protein
VKINHLWVFGIQLSKTHKISTKNKETQYMDDTKSNPYTLIAGFLLPWKVNKNSTRKATKQQ